MGKGPGGPTVLEAERAPAAHPHGAHPMMWTNRVTLHEVVLGSSWLVGGDAPRRVPPPMGRDSPDEGASALGGFSTLKRRPVGVTRRLEDCRLARGAVHVG